MDLYPYGFRPGASVNSPPLFTGSYYSQWKKRMIIFIQAQDIELWKVILLGPYIIKDGYGVIKKEKDYTDEDWKKVHINSKSMHLLLCSLDMHVQRAVSSCETAQEIWMTLEITYEHARFQY